jgi:hypothetical protein
MYLRMLQLPRNNYEDCALIALDMTRTAPAIIDHIFLKKLSNILTAYSHRNAKIGYPLISSKPIKTYFLCLHGVKKISSEVIFYPSLHTHSIATVLYTKHACDKKDK